MRKLLAPWKFGLLVLVSMVFTAACATIPTGPLAGGEMRVATLKVPQKVKAGEFYETVFEGVQKEGMLTLKDACFHWDQEGPYCFPLREVDGKVVARLRTRNPRTYTLSGYVRYTHEGKARESNEVSVTLHVAP